MKAHLIDTHLLVSRSRSSEKVKVKHQGNVSQRIAVLRALGFHKHILFLSFYQVKVTDREGNPPVGVTKRVKFDITYFFDQKVTQSIPNNLTFADFEMLSPFVPGETVLLQTKRKALDIDGSVKFSIEIPEGTATLSIKVGTG